SRNMVRGGLRSANRRWRKALRHDPGASAPRLGKQRYVPCRRRGGAGSFRQAEQVEQSSSVISSHAMPVQNGNAARSITRRETREAAREFIISALPARKLCAARRAQN